MRFLVAPQEFKSSLTAIEAADAIAAGVRDAFPDAEIDLAAMSDGGPGLVDAMLAARGGERIETDVHDPLLRPVHAAWALLPDGTAVIEMAAASGLVLLSSAERDPDVASTFGTGELIRAALDRGCRRIIVGVGGSATVDGGAGAMRALGARLLDASGVELPEGGAALARVARIDLSSVDKRLAGTKLRVASDVTNPLCGPQGAAVIFGPQKGATPEDVPMLDAALRRFAEVALRDTGVDVLSVPGGGAAGGLAAGLLIVAGATIEPGFALVAEAVGLSGRISHADAVITGEGRLDAQTAFGKTADGVAKVARAHGKLVAVVAGLVDASYDTTSPAFDVIEQTAPPGVRAEDASKNAASLVRDAAARAARRLMESGGGSARA